MGYVDLAFQSPLSNPHFSLKYNFSRDHHGVMSTEVEMDFEAEALASTVIHTAILRCSVFLTETISVGNGSQFQKINWVESCAKDRGVYLNGLHNVDHVVVQLKEHLELTDADIVSFQQTGSVLPVDSQAMIRSAIENASISGSVHGASTTTAPQPQRRQGQPQPQPISRQVPQPQGQPVPQPQPNRSNYPPQPTPSYGNQNQSRPAYPPQPQRGQPYPAQSGSYVNR